MKYSYFYKTSDGIRHEDEIVASSRDEAFAVLRKKGIRPIKVIAADGSKANGEQHGVRKRVVVAVSLFAVLATAAVFSVRWSIASQARAKKLQELVASVKEPVARFDAECKVLFRGGVPETKRTSIVEAKQLLDVARKDLSAACEKALAECPDDDESRRYLEAVKRTLVDELEKSRMSISNRRFAVVLLEENQGKWHFEGGRVVFDDPNLQRMFDYCCAGVR